jgi:hypothetical protein
MHKSGFTIHQDSQLYVLYIKNDNRTQIYNSIIKTNIIKNIIYDDTSITFSAENVTTLDHFLHNYTFDHPL